MARCHSKVVLTYDSRTEAKPYERPGGTANWYFTNNNCTEPKSLGMARCHSRAVLTYDGRTEPKPLNSQEG